MTEERFNELINGPLSHPMVLLRMARLVAALRAVADATGEEGERALEEFCAGRQRQDDIQARAE